MEVLDEHPEPRVARSLPHEWREVARFEQFRLREQRVGRDRYQLAAFKRSALYKTEIARPSTRCFRT
jgi:hypothetical protein